MLQQLGEVPFLVHVKFELLTAQILILHGDLAVALYLLRRREPADEYQRMSLLWLLPYLGCFGFLAGLTYPYYRFMNTTTAIMVLAGMGAWIASRFFLRRFRTAGRTT